MGQGINLVRFGVSKTCWLFGLRSHTQYCVAILSGGPTDKKAVVAGCHYRLAFAASIESDCAFEDWSVLPSTPPFSLQPMLPQSPSILFPVSFNSLTRNPPTSLSPPFLESCRISIPRPFRPFPPILTLTQTLLPQNLRTPHEQRPNITSQEPDILRLHRGHAHQVLRVCEVRVQLRELGVEVCVLAGFVGGG
jgi:hypothetical protein